LIHVIAQNDLIDPLTMKAPPVTRVRFSHENKTSRRCCAASGGFSNWRSSVGFTDSIRV